MGNSPGNYIVESVAGQRYNAGAPTNGVSAVQTLTGTATGGTFTLTFSGQVTSALPFNATAAQIQAALIALQAIGPGDVVCAGGPLGTAAVTVTFANSLAGLPVGAITVNAGALTGGTVTVAQTTAGVQGTHRGAPTGTPLSDTTNGVAYINTGTAAVPTWTKVGTQA